MAPAMTPTAAIFSPVKICGRPVGSFSLISVCHRLAPMRLEQHARVLVGGMQAGGRADDDRERGDEGGQRDLRGDAEAEPGDEQRREGDLRHGVDGHEIGHHGALAERRLADEHAKREADGDGDGEAVERPPAW